MQASNPAPVAPPLPPGPVVVVGPSGSPTAIYRGFENYRKELRSQLDALEEKRSELTSQLQHHDGEAPVDRAGLESRITEIDKRIGDLDKQVASADQQVAKAAAVPGAVVEPPRNDRNEPPEGVMILSGMFIVAVFFPLAIALARRIWRRGATAITAFPQELTDRLNRLDQAVDSIAVEVERIGEGQRFVTRVLTDSGQGRAVGAAAVPVDVAGRERARIAREGDR
jgi:hypothetical protein